MLCRWLAPLLVVLAIVFQARVARADQSTAHSVSVAVLTFDSDDAEEQADALTGALRSRVRASQGWSLVETSQSLGMLTAALRCSGKPMPPDCAQRIGEQIKSERYIFGYVTKGPQNGQVTAEVHLYQKNKPEAVVRESYADNLKDQNDDTLRKLAQHMLDRLAGSALGALVVRMGTENGEVVVDGEKHIPLQNGVARLELSPGGHSVEVVAGGQPAQKRNVLVTAGKETIVEVTLGPGAVPEAPPTESKPFPVKKVVGGVAMAIGVGLGAFAVERLLAYEDKKDELAARNLRPEDFLKTDGEVDVCDARLAKSGQVDEAACKSSKDAKAASTASIIAAAGGGIFLLGGAYLFFLSGDSNTKSSTTGKTLMPRIAPTMGYGSGGLTVSGRF